MRLLNSPDGKAVRMRQCPKVIITRWIYLRDIPRFTRDNRERANTASSIHNMPLIPDDYRVLYEILTPLSLFSSDMEVHPRTLC
jgi:hypothetical protein